MEITIDTILNVVGWLFGGGALGGLLTWRFTRRKAKAEALEAEAEAEQKKAEAEQERQNYYQQIIDDIAKDRDYYKNERNELRGRLDSMAETIRVLQTEVAKNGRKLDCLRPFLCGRTGCKDRICVEMTDEGEVTTKNEGLTIKNEQ